VSNKLEVGQEVWVRGKIYYIPKDTVNLVWFRTQSGLEISVHREDVLPAHAGPQVTDARNADTAYA
jgi:hypothetical protein